MYYYYIQGLNVASLEPISEMYAIEPTEEVDISIRPSDMDDVRHYIESEAMHRDDQGNLPGSVIKLGKELSILYYTNVGLFRITKGELIEYNAFIDSESPVFRQWLLGMAIAIATIQREGILLHGAALLMPESEEAFVVCGASGAGKSTISHELLKNGCRFMADDVAALEFIQDKLYVHGAYPTRRLCADMIAKDSIDPASLTEVIDGGRQKFILDMSKSYYGDKPRALKAIFMLNVSKECDQVRVAPYAGTHKLQHILYHLYKRTSYQSIGMTPKLMSECLKIASAIPVYEVTRPDGVDTVDEIVSEIMDLMGK